MSWNSSDMGYEEGYNSTNMESNFSITKNETFFQEEDAHQMHMTDYLEYKVGMAIVLWVFPVVIFVGTLGNLLSFIVLLTKRMRNTSVNIYLVYLALIDTLG